MYDVTMYYVVHHSLSELPRQCRGLQSPRPISIPSYPAGLPPAQTPVALALWAISTETIPNGKLWRDEIKPPGRRSLNCCPFSPQVHPTQQLRGWLACPRLLTLIRTPRPGRPFLRQEINLKIKRMRMQLWPKERQRSLESSILCTTALRIMKI